MHTKFQVKIFILYKTDKSKEVVIVNINYEKIEKEFDAYNKPIHKIRGLENSHKLTLKEMNEKGWTIEVVENVSDDTNSEISYMVYISNHETNHLS